MKRLTIGALVALCWIGLSSGTTNAQEFGQELGDIYLSFDVQEKVKTRNNIGPFQQFSWYLVVDITFADIGMPGQDGSNGIQGWESGVTIPDEITVTGTTFNPPGSVNVGQRPPDDPNDSNWIVGTGVLVSAASTPIQLVTYNGLLLAAGTDLVMSLGASDPSTFDRPGGPGPMPGWVEWNETGECPNHCLRPFAQWWERAVINCVNEPECNVVEGAIQIAAGHREGEPDSFVEIPVTVSRIPFAVEGDPSLLAGLELTFGWDPEVALLTDVILTPATSDWNLQYDPGPGTVDIAMVSEGSIDVPPAGVDVLFLQFQLGHNPGEATPLIISDSDAFDVIGVPIYHTTVGGSLTVGGATELLELAMGHGSGVVGSEVDVPFTVTRIPMVEGGDLSQLAGIDLMVEWDGGAATLVDVSLTPATGDWLMEFNAGSGIVDVSMASLSAIDVPPDGIDMLTFRYRLDGAGSSMLLPQVSTTPLMVTESRAFDIDQVAIDHVTADGSLSTDCEKGDVVADGEVNSADAIRGLHFAMGLLEPTPTEFCAADMSSDGVIDVGDVVLILQKAVGIVPEATGTPFLYARPGDALGDVILNVENVAGLDLLLTYDPDHVEFLAASAPGSAGLTLASDDEPGALRVGFAKATSYAGDIHLRFDVSEPHTTLSFREVFAFDEFGVKQPLDLLSDEFIFGVTGTGETLTASRTEFVGASPNPFNPMTQLRFVLSKPGDAAVQIFDSAGRRVRRIPLRGLSAGEHSVTWDGHDDEGARVASGAYLIQLQAGETIDTGRVLMLK